jgi:hypothetical protein
VGGYVHITQNDRMIYNDDVYASMFVVGSVSVWEVLVCGKC